MSIIKLQSKVSILNRSTAVQDAQGNWRVEIQLSDGNNVYSGNNISVGDLLLFNTSAVEASTITIFRVTNLVGYTYNSGFPDYYTVDMIYDESNDNTVQINDLNSLDMTGVISRPTSSLGLMATIAPGTQSLSDYWAEYVSNINLERLDSKLTDILGLDSNGDYVAQTSIGAVSILDDIQNLIQDIENLQTNAIVDGDFDSAGFMVTDGNGSYSVTSISALGAGDMLASLYDSNGDGIVNSADNVGGFTVGVDVPADAVFTDTVYTNSDVDLYLNSDSAGDGQVLSWDSAGNSYAWIDKGNTIFNISDTSFGVDVTGKIQVGTIDIGSGINTEAGASIDFEGTTIDFGSAIIDGGNAFDDIINHHLWSGNTKPTDGYVLSWNSSLDSGGDYEWVDNAASTGDSNRVVYDLTDPANSVILDAGDGINPATYYGDVIDSAGNTIVDVSSTSATFTGTLVGSVTGDIITDDGAHIVLDAGTDGTDGILTIPNITADGTVNFTGATVIGLDSAGYATSSDISDLQSQINTIAGTDSALDTLTELITYIKDLEAADSAGELSLIQDIADLQANVLFDNDFDSAGLMVTNGAGTYSIITDNSSNWNTAYGWGDHSSEGYLTTTTWTLTANGSSDYVFSGPGIETGNTNDPDIFLVRGQTYIFSNQSTGHPFEIRSSVGGSAYNNGVQNNGASGPDGDLIFTVPMDAPDKLYYQCKLHSSMLGNIIISDYSKSLVDSDFDSAGLMVTNGAGTYSIITDNSSNWNLAYEWGNHDSAGYLTASDTQDVLVDGDFDSAGIMVRGANAGDYSVITDNSSNWDLAHSWGNHDSAGYPKMEISDSAPSNPSVGDLWWNSDEGNLKIFYGNATDTAGDDIWVDASAAGYSGGTGGSSSSITNGTNGINVTNNTSGYNANAIEFETDDGNTSGVRWRFTPSGHLLPSSNANFDIGSAEYKVRHLFLSDNSLYFGEQTDSAGEMLKFTKDNVERNAEVYTIGDILDDELQTAVTAPTPTSAGKKGDIRIIDGFMYVCIRTAEVEDGFENWVRSAVELGW